MPSESIEFISPCRKKVEDCSFRFRKLGAFRALGRLPRRDGLQQLMEVIQVENLYPPVVF